MNEETVQVLLLDYLVGALRLALSSLDLADAPSQDTLRQLQALGSAREDLEAKAVAILTANGSSWGSLAQQLGVTRQSLHRRLSRRSVQLGSEAQSMSKRRLRTERTTLVRLLEAKLEELGRVDEVRMAPPSISRRSSDDDA